MRRLRAARRLFAGLLFALFFTAIPATASAEQFLGYAFQLNFVKVPPSATPIGPERALIVRDDLTLLVRLQTRECSGAHGAWIISMSPVVVRINGHRAGGLIYRIQCFRYPAIPQEVPGR